MIINEEEKKSGKKNKIVNFKWVDILIFKNPNDMSEEGAMENKNFYEE